MHVFDPNVLQEIARQHLGKPVDALLGDLGRALAERFPGHVRMSDDWVFNNAGGAMGAMLVLHASITEYLIFFGSPIGTEGHTGRFWADDYFIILAGEQRSYRPGQLEASVFRPGDLHHLPRGTAEGYRIPDSCWALEYARGFIPSMLPFGLADAFSSTLDARSVAKLFRVYGAHVVQELRQGKI